jgi:hypothetical protein
MSQFQFDKTSWTLSKYTYDIQIVHDDAIKVSLPSIQLHEKINFHLKHHIESHFQGEGKF